MSANFKDTLLELVEGKIDFEGQKLVENITRFTLIAASVSGACIHCRCPLPIPARCIWCLWCRLCSSVLGRLATMAYV
ncbi:hypothetical protein DAEQUDRAFT_522115 [Daedalea quercina L-15889]|uniref:Uncharacterized protein n=1 Tax=Daedalea quercina L-15889 TaxID=1314783 RepID=A0A165MD82_9APHY|nr:hypothetical protein DAEQUDRAFT_522115 [Daedalea quercina L-15889]